MDAEPRHLGAPAAGKPVSHGGSRYQLNGLVSHGDEQIARQSCTVLA